MAEYIDREELLLNCEEAMFLKDLTVEEKAEIIAKALDNASVADVRPVIHAKWVKDDVLMCRCSNCNAGKSQLVADYCGKCGARMDGE